MAHERKHYDLGGTGLRSLLDVYVCLKAEELDMRYVAAEAEKLGIGGFEEENRSLAMRLFGDAALADADEGMLSYVVDSGTFGTMEHKVDNQIARHGRAGYLLRRAFPPLQAMKALYPMLGNAPRPPACMLGRTPRVGRHHETQEGGLPTAGALSQKAVTVFRLKAPSGRIGLNFTGTVRY